ncbi:hypothetical protein F9278_45300 [Streptomyces phaeolivaceus]|uniref:Bacterial transcriptional activator domain-containing protein n=1 Tax=Streptomyces phaeolivaceus TaxID=2653200 RepID=A0A5P8KHU3_9ACTN|nr:hypothetical protein F9278_45300 [Streptomyces phaeolivaceus]
MIHRHIGEPRRLLEPGLAARAEGGWLLRGAGGYRLAVPEEAVDLLRFRQLAATAREFRNGGDPERAVLAFSDALALCRGHDAGSASAVAGHPVFTGLDREYSAVVGEAVDAALDCGTTARLLPVLRPTAARQAGRVRAGRGPLRARPRPVPGGRHPLLRGAHARTAR